MNNNNTQVLDLFQCWKKKVLIEENQDDMLMLI